MGTTLPHVATGLGKIPDLLQKAPMFSGVSQPPGFLFLRFKEGTRGVTLQRLHHSLQGHLWFG